MNVKRADNQKLTTLHWPSSRLLSHLALLLLLGPARSGDLVSSHEGTRLSNWHQIVGRDHTGVGVADKTARHSLGSDRMLGCQVLLTFLRRLEDELKLTGRNSDR